MFRQKIQAAAVIFTGFLCASAANAQPPRQCFTLASIQGNYGVVATYGANVALSLAVRTADGNGNWSANFIVNEPTPGSTTGARTIVTGTNIGTYTVNCNGIGQVQRLTTTNTGIVVAGVDDFVITAATVINGQLIATAIADMSETPSAIVPGGVFLTRVYTRLPDLYQ